MTAAKGKRRSRFEHVCRNGHVRTPENTYVKKDGARQCMDCPGWQQRSLSTKQRAEVNRTEPDADYYHRALSAKELAYLRSLIPCTGCGAAFGADHDDLCLVPYNREADGTHTTLERMRAAS